MSIWQAFVLSLVPLFLLQRFGMHWPTHKLRVAGILLLASYAGQAVTPQVGYPPILWYAVIDFLSACLVLARPAGAAQKAIGVCFAGMILYHAGIALAVWLFGTDINYAPYYDFMTRVGWLQFAILAAWGSWDSGGAVYNRFLRRRTVVTHSSPERAGGG